MTLASGQINVYGNCIYKADNTPAEKSEEHLDKMCP